MIAARRPFRALLCFACLTASPSAARAACHVVESGGAGNGADWAHALPDLPASLVRGDTYFVAAGTYGAHTFNDPDDGSTITIKGATSTDHCTDVGWASSAAVGTNGQEALWNDSPIELDTGHYVFDGNAGCGAPCLASGAASVGYGFHLRMSVKGTALRIGPGSGAAIAAVVLDRLNVDGVDAYQPDAFGNSNQFYSSGDFVDGVTIQRSYIHDNPGAILLIRHWSNFEFKYNYVARNRSTPVNHGEGVSTWGGSNHTYAYNAWEDIEGTAVIVNLNETTTHWSIYGNVFFHVLSNASWTGTGQGIVSDNQPGGVIDGLRFFNNTAAHLHGAGEDCKVFITNGSTDWVAYDNLFYDCGGVGVLINAQVHDYNSVIAGGWFQTMPSAHDFAAGSADPFVAASTLDFRLAGEKIDPHLDDGMDTSALLAANGVDMQGNARGADATWERGAFEVCSGGGCAELDAGPMDGDASGDAAGDAAGGAGGSGGSGGSGNGGAAGVPEAASSGGCGCRAAKAADASYAWALAAIVALTARRRRVSPEPSSLDGRRAWLSSLSRPRSRLRSRIGARPGSRE